MDGPFLLCKIENIQYRTRGTYMVLIKDFSNDFTNPRARSVRREGAKRPMRPQFSKLGVLSEGAKRPMRCQSKNWG